MKAVGQFDPANPSYFMDPLDRYVKAMAQVCEVPMHYFDPMGGAPSGESLNTASQPLNNKSKNFTGMFTSVYDDAYTFAMDIMGFDDVTFAFQWEPINTVTDSSGWSVVQQKINAGVPAPVALTESGYLPDQVQQWFGNDSVDLMQKVSILAQLGAAVQALGAGVTLGVVNEAQVQKAIADIIGDVEPEADITGDNTGKVGDA